MSHAFRARRDQVARNFAEYLNRVAFRGEHFILRRGSRPVAELRPAMTGRRLGDLPGLLASLPRLSEQDADGFARELNQARTELEGQELRDPWNPDRRQRPDRVRKAGAPRRTARIIYCRSS